MSPLGKDRWGFLTREVSLKTAAQAFVPVVAWIVFLFLFVSAFRAVVHVQGVPGVALRVLRSLVEIGTGVIALRYFFAILHRGMVRDLSVTPKRGAD